MPVAFKRSWLTVGLLFCLMFGTSAVAQTPPAAAAPAALALSAPETDASRRIDQSADILKQVETVIQSGDVAKKDLQAQQDKVAPLLSELQTLLGHLNAHRAAVKARLDQLGLPPKEKAPPENPQVTKERQTQQRDYERVDALFKRAKLLAVQAQQINDRIAERLRAQFTYSLLERGPSVADPILWMDVIAETPHALKTAQGAIGDWIGAINNRLPSWRAPAFWGLVLAVFVLYWPLSILAQRLLIPVSKNTKPSRLRKILAAWLVSAVIAGCPILAFLAVVGILEAFRQFDAPMQAVVHVLFNAVLSVALAAGLARGLLAPTHPNWRLLSLGNETSRHARATIVIVTLLTAASYLVFSLSVTIGADQIYQATLRGMGALLVALTIAAALWRNRAKECDSEDVLGPRVTPTRDWYGFLRVLLWFAVVAIIIAVLTGFMSLAGFLADQIVWVGGVSIVAIMSLILVEEVITTGCTPTAPFGRALISTVGLHRDSIDQLAILLGGAMTVAIFVTAILFVLAPWSIQATDLPTYLHAAFFGFHVGDITVSLSSLIMAIAIFVAGTMATRAVERWLEIRFLPHTRLDIGLRNAIKTSFGYLGFTLALGFALAYLGLNFEKLAIVAGALSVGIGFGLQTIVNNFLSGLILLWERAIRVGDWIVVGSEEGLVRRINVRSTEIETFDRVAVIVPNSNLISGVVKNYVRTDSTGRLQITLPINAAADPEKARDILLEIAKSQRLVLKDPAPFANFTSITASAFIFDLFCYVADVGTLGSVKSQLNFEIYRRFKADGLFAVPPPLSVVTLTGLEKFEPLLNKVINAASGNGLGSEKPTG